MNYSKKKLIIHLGYPKTGTTTLQNILFYNLHKKEDLNINYIGITKNVSDDVGLFDTVISREEFEN